MTEREDPFKKKPRPQPDPRRICDHCDGTVVEQFAGDEGWSVCEDCGTVEGGDHEEEDEDWESEDSWGYKIPSPLENYVRNNEHSEFL